MTAPRSLSQHTTYYNPRRKVLHTLTHVKRLNIPKKEGSPQNSSTKNILVFESASECVRQWLCVRVYESIIQYWHLYCFAILRSTSIVTHSLKQHVLRNRPESDAATPCDFLHERLQRANSCKPATLNCPTKPTRGDSLFYCSFHTTAGQWIRWTRTFSSRFCCLKHHNLFSGIPDSECTLLCITKGRTTETWIEHS